MKRTSSLFWMVACALACTGGAAMAQTSTNVAPPQAMPPANVCTTCGVVASVRYVEQKGQGSGVGLIAGGVVGGVLGHQLGSGRGNTVATIAGAGVGAYAGNEVEKNAKKTSYYVVNVRLDNGRTRAITQGAKPAVREGDRVKILDGKRIALLAN